MSVIGMNGDIMKTIKQRHGSLSVMQMKPEEANKMYQEGEEK